MKKLLLSISLAVAVNIAFLTALSALGTLPGRPPDISTPVVEILPAAKNQTRVARARVLPDLAPRTTEVRKPLPLRSGLSLSARKPKEKVFGEQRATPSPVPEIELKPDPQMTWTQADLFLPEFPVERKLLGTSEKWFDAGEVQVLPVKVKHIQPEYPKWALAQGLEGTVSLIFLIDETGKVTDVRITRSSQIAEFDASAVRAVKQWRYKPARKEGPVAVWQPCTIRFQLNQ